MTREGLPRCTGPTAPAQRPAGSSGGGSEPAAQDDPSLIVNPYLLKLVGDGKLLFCHVMQNSACTPV